MKYVLTDNGNIKIGADKKPLVLGDDGKEFEIDAIGAQGKIDAIVAESNGRRKKLGEATTKLEAFAGIEDPAAALEALATVGGLDDKLKLEADKLKGSINKIWEGKQAEWETEKNGLNDKLFQATTGAKFATSDVIKKTVLTPDIAQSYFGKHFNPDGTAKDAAGNPIMSKESPGDPAGFDEAMTTILNAYPGKDSIMRSEASGGGGGHSAGGGGEGQAMTPADKISAGLKKMRGG